MSATAYIGRVGALAVALGVGTAVFTGHGIAFAQDESSPSSSADSSTTTDSDTSDSAEADSAESDDDEQSEAEPSETDESAESAEDTSTEPDDDTSSEIASEGPSTEETSASVPSETPDPEREVVVGAGGTDETSTESDTSASAVSSRRSETVEASKDNAVDVAIEREPAVVESRLATTPEVGEDTVAAIALAAAPTVRAQPSVLVAAAPTARPVAARPASPLAFVAGAVMDVVSSVVSMLVSPFTAPGSPTAPVALALLAGVRREIEQIRTAFFNPLGVAAPEPAPTLVLDPAVSREMAAMAFAAAAAVPTADNGAAPGQILTTFAGWVTGQNSINQTSSRFGIAGTDLGIMWDNGMVDDPATPHDERQVLIALGDTFSGPNMSGAWRYNTLLRSSDTNLIDGMYVPNGEWFNGNMFGGAPLSNPTFARPIINRPAGVPGGITLIPTAGVSVSTPGTRFGVTQYVNFMSVTNWGAPGYWSTNYSAIAYSVDNGENFTVAPQTIRYNTPGTGNEKFQQGAFVKSGGFIYSYGTPPGRQGGAYLARVPEGQILNLGQYSYWNGSSWTQNNPRAAVAVLPAPVSEMSVMWNDYLQKYIVLHADAANNIVARIADRPEGTWSGPYTLLESRYVPTIYAPMIHPWSSGRNLYWNLSLFSTYNVGLMVTALP